MADVAGFSSGVAAGLVPSETTHAGGGELHPVYLDLIRRAGINYRPGLKVLTRADQEDRRLRKMRQNVLTSARLHMEETGKGGLRGKWAMLTLTYRDEAEWSADQIGQMLNRLRDFATRAGFKARYTWVLELTKRGRPHYHVLCWLPKGRTLPKPDKRGWWTHGLTRIEWARNALGYVAKYASKGGLADGHQMPKGARLSGFGGLQAGGRIELRWWKLPTWVRKVWNEICNVGRVSGGVSETGERVASGYVNRATGEVLASPYRVVFAGGVCFIYEVQL